MTATLPVTPKLPLSSGYTRENIKTNIDEEGNKMVITCEKPVQETVKVGWTVIKKDIEIRKFTKVFKIPVGVILDKIETNFNEEASILTITMPKRVEGILGTGIQEVKEPENLPFRVDEIPKKATFHEDKGAEFSSAGSESAYRKGEASRETEMQPGFPSNIQKSHAEVEKPGAQDEVPQRETEKPKAEPKSQKIEDMGDGKLECTNLKDDKICEKANGIEEEEEDKLPERRSKICVPVIAGSAVILSLVVFGIYFMRNKKQPGKRKE